ncbi:MAG: CHAP domain-containing protein [Desulfobacteraceae bacterium]|nr:CHAP domain-containing protein [Desulfobacteraceae bacterium]
MISKIKYITAYHSCAVLILVFLISMISNNAYGYENTNNSLFSDRHCWDFDNEGTEGWSTINALDQGIYNYGYWQLDPPENKSGIVSPVLNAVHTDDYDMIEIRAADNYVFLNLLDVYFKIEDSWKGPVSIPYVSGVQGVGNQCIYRGNIDYAGVIQQIRIDFHEGTEIADDRVYIDYVKLTSADIFNYENAGNIFGINPANQAYTTENIFYNAGYGWQSTAFVWGRVLDHLGIKIEFSAEPGINGKNWPETIINDNITFETAPKRNSIAVWNGGDYGHVAYVEHVDSDIVYISEANVETFRDTDFGGGYDGFCKKVHVSDMSNRGAAIGELSGYLYLSSPFSDYFYWDFDSQGTENWNPRNSLNQGIYNGNYWQIDLVPDSASKSGIISPMLSSIHTDDYNTIEIRAGHKNKFLEALEVYFKINDFWKGALSVPYISGDMQADSQCIYSGKIDYTGQIQQIRIDFDEGSDSQDDMVYIDYVRLAWTELPDSPELFLPDNGGEFCKGNDIIFDWLPVDGAQGYEIWIDNSEGFSGPEIGFNSGINDGIVSDNQFILTSEMGYKLEQNYYHWKVRALDSEEKEMTEWSETRKFTLLDFPITISCELSEEQIVIGESLRISGQISPALATNVNIAFIPP